MCLRALTPAAALPGGRLNKDCCRRGSPRAIYRSRGFRNPSAAARKKHFKVFPKTTFVPTSPLISLSGPQNAVDGQLCVRGVVAYVSDLKHRPIIQSRIRPRGFPALPHPILASKVNSDIQNLQFLMILVRPANHTFRIFVPRAGYLGLVG